MLTAVYQKYYLRLAYEHNQEEDYFGLDIESANLETAFEQAIQTDAQTAYVLASYCADFLSNRGRFHLHKDWMERSVAALSDHPDESLRDAAKNSLAVATIEYPFGDRSVNLHRGIDLYQSLLEYAMEVSNQTDIATTQINLGNAFMTLADFEDASGNLHRAKDHIEAALNSLGMQNFTINRSKAQIGLGEVYRRLANIEKQTHVLLSLTHSFGNCPK